jgi:glucosamine--fructose-6-phosphate aminotransferase (isomerizing)
MVLAILSNFMRKYLMPKLGVIMESEINEIPVVFQNVIKGAKQFEQLGDLLTTSGFKSVQILARGTSDNAAHFLKYLIETKVGLPVGLTSPSAVTIYGTELKFNSTLLIAISQSGQSTDLIKFATAAKSGGGYFIAITNDQNSPLAKISNTHISLLAGKESAVAATKSYAAQLLTCFLLVNYWIDKDLSQRYLKLIYSSTLAIIEKQDLISAAITKINIKNDLVFLGRGFSYPNAREFALKIQETSKISVQGLSIADYMHGPISALTDKTQLFIVTQNDSDLSYYKDYLVGLRDRNPKIFWIGDSSLALENEEVINGAKSGNEVINCIVDCVIGQKLALELARKNGLNPDKPEGLSKVTLTN